MSVISDRELTPTHVQTYAALALFADKDGVCFPSVRRLCEIMGLDPDASRSALRRRFAWLVERGHVSIERRYRSDGSSASNAYRLSSLPCCPPECGVVGSRIVVDDHGVETEDGEHGAEPGRGAETHLPPGAGPAGGTGYNHDQKGSLGTPPRGLASSPINRPLESESKNQTLDQSLPLLAPVEAIAPPPKRPAPKPKVRLAGQANAFDRFWARYPRKTAKGAAVSKFAAALGKADLEAIMAGLEAAIARWGRDGTPAQFIPHPATWLSQERWGDEDVAPAVPQTAAGRLAEWERQEPMPAEEAWYDVEDGHRVLVPSRAPLAWRLWLQERTRLQRLVDAEEDAAQRNGGLNRPGRR